ncbi:hypothetical protein HYS94_04190 [Candidatus Daviesbacteria bacterium]|nr:hypothetical protein [Candidatus Daviesbacteria bacterium]
MNKVVVSAPGKVHLLGEWSVVWGKPALITTVDLRMTATIMPSTHLRGVSSHLGGVTIQKIIEPIIKKELKLKKIPAYSLKIESAVPMGVHLGSSAAVAVTSVAALLSYLKVKWDLELINKLAYQVEKVLQGNPSGADNSTIVYGGLVWYRKENEDLKIIEQLPFTIPPKLSKNFILINTGTPKLTTKKMIAQITAVFEKKTKLMHDFLSIQEKLTRELLTAVKDADENELIRIIRAGEKNLESISVASKLAQDIIRKIETVGGAAKICGAGAFSGPTGVLLCYHRNKKVVEKIARDYSLPFFTKKLGVEGVKRAW